MTALPSSGFRPILVSGLLALVGFGLAYASPSAATTGKNKTSHRRVCNALDGYLIDEPDVSGDIIENDGKSDPLTGDADAGVEAPGSPKFDRQTIELDLGKVFSSLKGLKGDYVDGSPVLGVRLEQPSRYDPTRSCNAIAPIVYKPKLEKTDDHHWTASVDNKRFSITFDPAGKNPPFSGDADPTKRFFWIFRSNFGSNLKSVTAKYETTFQSAQSVKERRNIARTYINLTLRYDRMLGVGKDFPRRPLPSQQDVEALATTIYGFPCVPGNQALECLVARLVATNEAPFTTALKLTDALGENSGLSAGLRQLDFGGSNDQANALVRKLLPTTVGRFAKGKGYRRPIRRWSVDELNNWVYRDGVLANAELSQPDARALLIQSFPLFIRDYSERWSTRVGNKYSSWTPGEKEMLELIAIDLENVTGYQLYLPAGMPDACGALTDTTINLSDSKRRSNIRIFSSQVRRMTNAKIILNDTSLGAAINQACLP